MATTTKLIIGNLARQKILGGVNAIYNAVKLTLGPAASSALLYRTFGRGPRIVDDGHFIAQVIEPKDEAEQLAAQVFKEAAEQTNKKAGDGTATTTVIAGSLINGIFNRIAETANSYAISSKFNLKIICRQLLELSKDIQKRIKEKSKKIETLEDLEKIAIVSLNDEVVGKVVAKIVWETGVDGFVDVVEGYKGELETDIVKGARFPATPAAKAFINNPKRFEMIIDNCPILLTNYKIDNDAQVRDIFGKLFQKTSKLAILAPDFSDQVLMAMVQTCKTGSFMFPVKVPSLRTEQFEDLAIYFDAKFIDKNSGKKLETITEEDLGLAEKLVIKDVEAKEDAVAIGGRGSYEKKIAVGDKEMIGGSPVAERIKILKEQINEERIDSHKKLLERRVASLASAVGVIRVGASTSAESLPLKTKIEDAQYAAKAALEEGYVKGGGLCLKEIAEEMEKETTEKNEAFNILMKSLKSPYEQIQINNEEPFEIKDEIIDPVKAVRMEVENAISVAANLITCQIIIPEERELSPAEGYLEIAKQLKINNMILAKKEGILKENLNEMAADYEEKIALDNG